MGLVYVDSGVWITFMEGKDDWSRMIEERLQEIAENHHGICVSNAVESEVLAKPVRTDNRYLIKAYRKTLSGAFHLPLFNTLFDTAKRIMQVEKLKAMDSIHLAFASHYNCDAFLTTDKDFNATKEVKPILIDLEATLQ